MLLETTRLEQEIGEAGDTTREVEGSWDEGGRTGGS